MARTGRIAQKALYPYIEEVILSQLKTHDLVADSIEEMSTRTLGIFISWEEADGINRMISVSFHDETFSSFISISIEAWLEVDGTTRLGALRVARVELPVDNSALSIALKEAFEAVRAYGPEDLTM